MYEKLLEHDKDETPDTYWGFRKERLFVERTHLRFRYLFRLIDFAIALYVFFMASTLVFGRWMGEEFIDYFSGVFALIGLSAYVWLRRLPVRGLEDSAISEGDLNDAEPSDVEQNTKQLD